MPLRPPSHEQIDRNFRICNVQLRCITPREQDRKIISPLIIIRNASRKLATNIIWACVIPLPSSISASASPSHFGSVRHLASAWRAALLRLVFAADHVRFVPASAAVPNVHRTVPSAISATEWMRRVPYCEQ